ncbi:hypothetical protein [Acinetobacter sp.]|uniref:hypothetical protein n=1 Tax=Acinetobacter sp. TaxID=472 RepID=UPI00388DDA07
MGIIKIYERGSKKVKKKPGWKEREAEEKAWLDGINKMKLLPSNKKVKHTNSPAPKKMPSLRVELETKQRTSGESVVVPGIAGTTKKVMRPEIEYKDNPEMLERELKARERVFPVAPGYNKSGDMLVTPEMMKDIRTGGGRRRS